MMRLKLIFVLCFCMAVYSISYFNETALEERIHQIQGNRRLKSVCDNSAQSNKGYERYFNAMKSIYQENIDNTCLSQHLTCGWPVEKSNNLPTFVLSIGLEGAGHHLWTQLLEQPVFDCVWINGRHYQRDIADGVPRTTPLHLASGFKEQFELRKQSGKPACKKIYDAEDSFPTGAIRKSGRVFMRPDLINLEMLNGIVFNVKYLIIARNVTDTALSALRRNFFSAIDPELRTVEHTLSYIEAALRGVPCHRTFIAHYEHVLAEPSAYLEPLATFFELNGNEKDALRGRLEKPGKPANRKAHKLTQFSECNGMSEESCYKKIVKDLDTFFNVRGFMWPTFSGNGFDFKRKQTK